MPQKMGEMMKCARHKEREMNLIKDIAGVDVDVRRKI
jgi:hypothetical protein